MRILIDMDGTIADWGAKWDELAADYLHLGLPLTKHQKDFNLYLGLDEEGIAAVTKIMEHPNFYRELAPFEGAVEALHAMLDEGHEVFLVTSPWITNQTCASDKIFWAETVLGSGWGKRVVITSDKTLIRGDILIDDKPVITGAEDPEWEHIWFTQPYNRELNHYRRLDSWADWREIVYT